jgi:hypothetical protein
LVLDAPERVGRADVARRSRCDLAGPARRGRPTPASPCALGPSRAATYACSQQQFQNERAKDRNTRSFNLKQETTEGSEEETRDCNALKNLKHELVPFSPSSLKITVGLERQRQLMIRPDFGGGGRTRRLEDGREQELHVLRSSEVCLGNPSIYSGPGPARRSIELDYSFKNYSCSIPINKGRLVS